MKALKNRMQPLPPHWVRRRNDEGVTFYVNELSGEATYEKPQPLPAGWRMTKDSATGQVYMWNVTTRETRPLPSPPPPPLPPHWVQRLSDEGVTFYVNELSGEATYEKPRPLPAGWQLTKDSATGQVYMWNATTRETRLLPSAPPPPLTPPADPGSSSRAERTISLAPPSAPNARRIRLYSVAGVMFGTATCGKGIVVTSAPAVSEGPCLHVGDVLLSVDDHACPADAAGALQMLTRAHATRGFVDVEVETQGSTGSINKGDSNMSIAATLSLPLGRHISGQL